MHLSTGALIQVVSESWGAVFCIMMVIILISEKKDKISFWREMLTMHIATIVMLVSDVLAWLFRGVPGLFPGIIVRASNFLVFFMGYLIIFHYTIYIYHKLPEQEQKKMRPWIGYVGTVCCIGGLLLLVNAFTGFCYAFDGNNTYYRTGGYIFILLIGFLATPVDMVFLFRSRKSMGKLNFAADISYLILPIMAMIILIFYYGISLSSIAVMISMLFMFVTSYADHFHQIVQKEKELYDLRVRIMISQVEPHFIYNSLSTIQHLCRKDPDEAAHAVNDFAGFLRNNLEALEKEKSIPFEQEKMHVETYLALEKRRFKERINVVWDVQENNFTIPALTLQPIVENAVKHGICKKVSGGTIHIRVSVHDNNSIPLNHYEELKKFSELDSLLEGQQCFQKDMGDFWYEILVEDDGVGFHAKEERFDKNHVGIRNVSRRLDMMCDGDLTVISEKGKGTTAIIRLPESCGIL